MFPTIADTFPLVVLDAMAAGLPVISTLVGGIPNQVLPGFSVLVAPRSAAELGKAIESMARLPRSRLKEMGASAKQHALANFTWRSSAEITLRAYKTVLGCASERLL